MLHAQETFDGWDEFRTALRTRNPKEAAVRGWFLLREPRRLRALARLLRWRAHTRRFGRLFADDGTPSIAYLPGSSVERPLRDGDRDLRTAPKPLAALLKGPTAEVAPGSPSAAKAVLALAVALRRLPRAAQRRAAGL